MQRAGSRRQTLRWLAAAGAAGAGLSACGRGADVTGQSASGAVCHAIPEETAGPFPGDGSNRAGDAVANVLVQSGVLRSDIRRSFGASTTLAPGVALNVSLQLVNPAAACTPLEGYAVYLWHCDREGRYSMYSEGIKQENYLRGVQVSDARGQVQFTTIFPACYDGRWPHIHFEVFDRLASATQAGAGKAVRTSQLALPEADCRVVFATEGYAASAANFARARLERDNVFGDDAAAHQLARVQGDPTSGYSATLEVGIPG